MKHRVVLVGRVILKRRLVGGKFYDLDDKSTRIIDRRYFKEFFNNYTVLNCDFKDNHLSSKWNNFNLSGVPLYNTNGELVKYGYTELRIIECGYRHLSSNLIYTGARIVDPDSDEGIQFAILYYGLVRSMKNDVNNIYNNIKNLKLGISLEDLMRIKKYVFLDKHIFQDGKIDRFPPDCAMAHSWQRLAGYVNEPIQKHDITLLKHELMEMRLVNDNNMKQSEAHRLASKVHNYGRECLEFYKNLEKR